MLVSLNMVVRHKLCGSQRFEGKVCFHLQG